MQRTAIRTIALVLLETVMILLLVGLATWIRLPDRVWDVFLFENGAYKAVIVTGVTQTCLYFGDLYSLRYAADRRELWIRIIQSLAAASFILAALYFWFPDLMLGRGVFFIAAILIMIGVVG